MLEKEFQYYIDHQAEFVQKYQGKFIVLVGEELIGVHDTLEDAIIETGKIHKPGTFLVQECQPGKDNYTLTFHSRAVFA